LNTGSDATLIREGLLKFTKQRIFRNKLFNLGYLGEKVPVKFEFKVLVELGEFSMKIPIYVVDMKDDWGMIFFWR